MTGDMAVGIELTPAAVALLYYNLPGYESLGIDYWDTEDPYIHHFPDGNASVARLIVRKLIPGVAPGNTMEDIVTAPFDYSRLDEPSSPVRLRLNSTVTHVENANGGVAIQYVANGDANQLRAEHCVLACFNSIIPHICPDLPDEQGEAISQLVRSPMMYTNVALTNWRAWKNLGVGSVYAPGSYHVVTQLDFPVSMGDYAFAEDPEEPIIVHMEHFPIRFDPGTSAREQRRQGRYDLLATPYETMERSIRQQLADILGDGGFDPAEDIAGITVNRWAHGYADSYTSIDDPDYGGRYPHVTGRQPIGRISIANSDAGGSAMLESAIMQAHRAVGDLS